MEKKVSKLKNNKEKPTKRIPSLITKTGEKGVGKPNKVVEKPKKRIPLDLIPVQKGTGKTIKVKEKPNISKSLSESKRRTILAIGGVLVTAFLAKTLFDMVLKNDAEDHEKVKNEVFDVVSNNCSSLGVNKMAIVDKTSKMIRNERLKRKRADKRIEELERFILNYNSLPKEEIEDMLQEIKSKNEKNG